MRDKIPGINEITMSITPGVSNDAPGHVNRTAVRVEFPGDIPVDIPEILEKLAAFAPTEREQFMVFAERTLAATDPLTVRFMLLRVAQSGLQVAYAAALLAQKPADVAAEWWLCSAPPDAHARAFVQVMS